MRETARPDTRSSINPRDWSLRVKLTLFTLAVSLVPVLVLSFVDNMRVREALVNHTDPMAGSALVVVAITLLLSGALSFVIAASVSNPLRRLAEDAGRLALGDLERTSVERSSSRGVAAEGSQVASPMVDTGADERVCAERRRLASRIASEQPVVAAVTGLRQDPKVVHDLLVKYWKSSSHFTGVFAMDARGRCVAAADPKMVGKSYDFRPYFQEAMQGNLYTSDISLSIDTLSPQVVHSAPIRQGGQVVGVLALRSDASEEFKLATGAILSTGGNEVEKLREAFVRVRLYLVRVSMVVDRVASGDLSQEVKPQSNRDILGIAVDRMVSRLGEVVAELRRTADGLAKSSTQLEGATSQAGSVVQQVADAMQNMAGGSQEVSRSAQTSNDAVGQLSHAIESIARGADQQSRQVEAASAAASQMAERVDRVAGNAGQLAAAGDQTKRSAEQGARAVGETVAGMAEIKQVVLEAAAKVEELGNLGEKIGDVVETINDIAEQTNLLALNAAIEAARAGEHGRGFAVVADEVRKLAERSQRETRSIGELIKGVQGGTRDAVVAMQSGSAQVEEGSKRAEQAHQALQEILLAVASMAQQVSEIASAAQEMAEGARSVVESMEGISAVVEENSASTQEMARQASVVTSSAESVAAVAEENSASTEEVLASAQEMSAQIQQMSAEAQELATAAEDLRETVARFKLQEAVADRPVVATSSKVAHLVPLSR